MKKPNPNTNTREQKKDNRCWFKIYQNREEKHPRSLDNHHFGISLFDKAIDELGFFADGKWLKKPCVNFVKRNHKNFFLSYRLLQNNQEKNENYFVFWEFFSEIFSIFFSWVFFDFSSSWQELLFVSIHFSIFTTRPPLLLTPKLNLSTIFSVIRKSPLPRFPI